MDYFMPNSNGLETIRKLYDAKITIPIIFLTANKDFRVAVEAMKALGVYESLTSKFVQGSNIAQAQIQPLPGNRVQRLCGVAYHHQTFSDDLIYRLER